MKKILSVIMLCSIMTFSCVSCSNSNNSSDKENTSYSGPAFGEIQRGDSAEAAFREFFSVNYTRDSGEAAFNYMYIQPVINMMKDEGKYREMVVEFNNTVSQKLEMYKTMPQIKSIDEVTQLTDEQLEYAKKFLADSAESQGVVVNAEDLPISEGWNFKATVIDYNGNESTDTECFVKVEDKEQDYNEGWKYAMNLGFLESQYSSQPK